MRTDLRRLFTSVLAAGGGTVFNPLLFDQFLTDRSAGAINGTAAEPGGSDALTRVVSDTGSKATIANDIFTVASGGSTDTPNLTYSSSYARVEGRVAAAKLYIHKAATGGAQLFGWSSTSNGTTYTHRYYIENQKLMVLNNGTGNYPCNVGKVSSDAPLWLAVVTRATGAFFFAFGGQSFGKMMLTRVHRVLTTTPLYPAWTHYTSGTGQGVTDFVVPSDLYIPTALVSGTGVSGTLNVSDSGKTDTVCVAGLTRAGGNIGIVTRYADANNYVITYHDGTNVKIDKVVGGSSSNVANVAKTYSAGADLEVVWNGTNIRAFYNGNQLSDDGYTVSDAGLQTGTQVGVYSTNAGNSVTNFECFARGAGGEHAALKASVVRSQTRNLIVFDGDSLTAGLNLTVAESYPYKVLDTEGRANYDGYNLGVSAQYATHIAADLAAQVLPLVGVWARNYYVLWAGTNDLTDGGASAADTYASLTSTIQAAKAAGFTVLVLTMIKRSTDAPLETKRQAYNVLINANTAGADAVIDVGANAAFSDVNNTTYYQGDKVHITATGATVVAGLVSDAIT